MKNSEASSSPQLLPRNRTVTVLAVACLLLLGAVGCLSFLAFGKGDGQIAPSLKKPLTASDLEIRGTTTMQKYAIVFSGRITNTGGSTAQEVSFTGTLSGWMKGSTLPALSGYEMKVPVDTIKNLKAGETRELSYVVNSVFSYKQLLEKGAPLSSEDFQMQHFKEEDPNGEYPVNRFNATQLTIEPTLEGGK